MSSGSVSNEDPRHLDPQDLIKASEARDDPSEMDPQSESKDRQTEAPGLVESDVGKHDDAEGAIGAEDLKKPEDADKAVRSEEEEVSDGDGDDDKPPTPPGFRIKGPTSFGASRGSSGRGRGGSGRGR